MKTNFLFICSVALLVGTAQSTAFALNAEELLSRDLISTSKTLKNEIKIYNYFFLEKSFSELQSENGRKSFIRRYLSQRAGSFWDMDFTDASTKNYAAGPALYFAIDPHISQAYGNSFIELTVPAGSRYVNVVNPIPVKKDTIAALVAEGFLTTQGVAEVFPKQAGFYRDTLRVMVLPQYSNFRNLVQTIFRDNLIQFIEYNFNTSLQGFCAKHSYSAFAYIGVKNSGDPDNALVSPAFANTTVYSTALAFNQQSATEQLDFARILKFRTLLEQIPLQKKAGKSVKELISNTYSAAEVQQIKTHTFSCDN